jgi:hypothetical protein
MTSTYLIALLFFLIMFPFGYWLSRMGKPYSNLLVTIHKLAGLGVGIYLVTSVYRAHQAAGLAPLQIAITTLTALIFIALVATGSILTAERTMPPIVAALHKVLPYLAVVSTGGLLYVLY